MTQQETLKYNIRCAEFLGWDYSEERDRWNEDMLHQYSFVESIELKFHSDWNWIMEVIEKIYSLNIYYDKYKPLNSSQFTNGEIELTTNKEAVVEAINQFLIWHEQNK